MAWDDLTSYIPRGFALSSDLPSIGRGLGTVARRGAEAVEGGLESIPGVGPLARTLESFVTEPEPTPRAFRPAGQPTPLKPPAEPDYSHFEQDVRNDLAGAPRGFVDERVDRPSPLDPNGPRDVPKDNTTKARAVLLPGGKILLTNQDSGPSGQSYAGQELSGKGLYDAVAKRGAGVSSAQRAGLDASGHHPQVADWRQGTVMETPATRELGKVGPYGTVAEGMRQNPEYHGAYSQLEPNKDQAVELALEDAARQSAVYRGQADVESARQQAQDAGMSVEERAQATAAARAPELLGMQAIRAEQQRAARALQEWDRRSSTPGDPAFVEPNQRLLARRKIQDDLEENIKVLASVVGRQRQLPEGFAGLGG